MKATDLMIGDWVKIKGHLDYDKVREIARDDLIDKKERKAIENFIKAVQEKYGKE